MIKFFQKLKAKKGFTLVELIVVIAIIGVLAAILIPTMLGYVTSSRVQSANSTAAEVKNTVNNWITELDSKGYSIKRVADVDTWTITFGSTVTVTDCDNTDFNVPSTFSGTISDDLVTKITNDYPADPAQAIVYIKNGSAFAAVYCSGGTVPSGDGNAPDSDDFVAANGFAWGGSADGVAGTGEIVGTSPILTKPIGSGS